VAMDQDSHMRTPLRWSGSSLPSGISLEISLGEGLGPSSEYQTRSAFFATPPGKDRAREVGKARAGCPAGGVPHDTRSSLQGPSPPGLPGG
jgi:hypothetical protein